MWKKRTIHDAEEPIIVGGVNQADKEAGEEERNGEIEESLQEIYEDGKGGVVNVKEFDIKKRHSPLFWGIIIGLLLFAGGLGGWFYYDYHSFQEPASNNFEVTISADKDKVVAGEEIGLKIAYKNKEKVAVNSLELRATLPDNFIFLSSVPEASGSSTSAKNLYWEIGDLGPNRSGEINIKGKAMAKSGDQLPIYVEAGYVPANFSSQFKKMSALELEVREIGLDFSFDSFSNVIAGDENELNIKFRKQDPSFIENFIVSLEHSNGNLEIMPADYSELAWLSRQATNPLEWTVTEISSEERQFPVKFKIKDKITPQDGFILKVFCPIEGKRYEILNQPFTFDILKGDLSLSLIINGSKSDQGANLGDTLAYLLSYANKSDTAYKDVVIMAVIAGRSIDWTSLEDQAQGIKSADTVTWSKNEIPELGELAPGAEGSIEFSLKIKNQPVETGSDAGQIKSYASYSIASSQAGEDNQSNIIINKLNSRINFEESVRYFNEDNMAVGSGPIPPQSGQTTAYKVSWSIGGNIHELIGAQVESTLPEGVSFAGGAYTNVGRVDFDSASRRVVWTIGRLPIIGEKISASFSISVSPNSNDINKILVLSSGASASGVDSETGNQIQNSSSPKTTKLEDDDIGASDGLVR